MGFEEEFNEKDAAIKDTDGWIKWSKYVIMAIVDLKKSVDRLSDEINDSRKDLEKKYDDKLKDVYAEIDKVKSDIGDLKTKSAVVGAISAILMAVLLKFFKF